ncbi:ankyrin [Coprinopsis marcescibilis]|uniref:Ankyrin n=1 Tax=Coprinopsis marcescibilis TaxID=230819 RepID=A0A5C3L5H0_COPMA|nr:ankyrin [Coprinopsis marcescibilis]
MSKSKSKSKSKPKPTPKRTYDFTTPQTFKTVPRSGLVVTDEMKKLLAKPGFLSSKDGGEKLRQLYQDHSVGFSFEQLSPFGQACWFGRLENMIEILGSGFVPDLAAKETVYEKPYATLLVLGSQRVTTLSGAPTRHLEVLQFLISRGLPVNLHDIVGHTALHHAVIGDMPRKQEIMKILIKAGADVNGRNRWGEPPLLSAIVSGDVVGMEVLLEGGADINICDADDVSPSKNYVVYGPRVAATFEKWLKIRSGKPDPLTTKSCAQCGVKNTPLKNCSRCLTVQYCSKECQAAAWKGHKPDCKPFDKKTTITVKPSYDSPFQGPVIPNTAVTHGLFGRGNPVPETHFRNSHIPKDLTSEGKQVVIKVQAPYPGSAPTPEGVYQDMLVYTRKRDFVCYIQRKTSREAYDTLLETIRGRGVESLKAYFVAILKSPEELVIKFSEPLAAQPW